MDGQDLDRLKRLRDVAHSKFKRKSKCLQEQIDKQGTREILQRCFDEMNKAYEKLEEAHESYLGKICLTNNSDVELENEEAFMDNVDALRIDVTSAYDKAMAKSVDDQDTASGKQKVEEKPIDLPKYDGNFSDIPSTSKQCSSGEALNTSKGDEGQVKKQDEDQAMDFFKMMFPDVKSDVIETMLRINQGDVQGTLDSLLKMNTDTTEQEIINKLVVNMDKVKECCVCREVYNETNHRPLNLPCGHTICKSCVNNISSTPHSIECVTVVQCPICRVNHTVNRNELPTNFVLLHLLRTTGNIDQSNESSVPNSKSNEDNSKSKRNHFNSEEEKDKSEKQSKTEDSDGTGYSTKKILTGVGLGLGAVGAVAAAPVVLAGVGFTSAGIAAGSWAAGMMSSAAAAGGGGVAAGSLVALLQSAGVVGLGAGATAGVAAGGAAAGAAAGHFAGAFADDEKSDKTKSHEKRN